MKTFEIQSLQALRIPCEKQLWNLLLDDPYFKQIRPEIQQFYDDDPYLYNSDIEDNCKDLTGKSKESKLIEDLCKQLNLKREIRVYEYNSTKEFRNISFVHKKESSSIFIAKPITKVLLERELIPLFIHCLGDFIFETPLHIPIRFLNEKLNQNYCFAEENNLKRLFYLTTILEAIEMYNCDCLSVYLTNFESTILSQIQLERTMYGHCLPLNLEGLIRNFSKYTKRKGADYLEDLTCRHYRYFMLYLFSKEHNLIESDNLKKIKLKIDINTVLNPSLIRKTYFNMLYPQLTEINNNKALDGDFISKSTNGYDLDDLIDLSKN